MQNVILSQFLKLSFWPKIVHTPSWLKVEYAKQTGYVIFKSQ